MEKSCENCGKKEICALKCNSELCNKEERWESLATLNCIDCKHWQGWVCEGKCRECVDYDEFEQRKEE